MRLFHAKLSSVQYIPVQILSIVLDKFRACFTHFFKFHSCWMNDWVSEDLSHTSFIMLYKISSIIKACSYSSCQNNFKCERNTNVFIFLSKSHHASGTLYTGIIFL